MRLAIPAVVLAALILPAQAQAGRFEIGPRIAMFQPTGSAGDALGLGVCGGLTINYMRDAERGFGVDLVYHEWPSSPAAEAEVNALFDALVGQEANAALNMNALEATAHGKAVVWSKGPVEPWVQIGAGGYYVRSSLELFGDSSVDATWKFGLTGGVGFDVKTVAKTKFGLDASYHYLVWPYSRTRLVDSGQGFTAFTLGVHVLRW